MYCECQLVDLQISKLFHEVQNPVMNLSLLTTGFVLFFLILIVKVLNPQVETSDVMTSPLKKALLWEESRNLKVLETTPVIYHFSPFPHPRMMQDGCLPWRQTVTRCKMVRVFLVCLNGVFSVVLLMTHLSILWFVLNVKNLLIIWINKYPSVWYSESS